MKRAIHLLIVATLAAEALVLGQGSDVDKILADARVALGGDALAGVTSIAASGRTSHFSSDSAPTDFELAIQLPDRYVKKEVVAVMGDSTIARTSGFNGEGLIEGIDVPPGMFGGGGNGQMVVRSTSGGGTTTFGGPGGQKVTADDSTRKANVLLSKQDFARLTLGMFAASFSAYPLHFAVGAAADAPDGKSDVILVTGDGDFSAKFFVDRQSHLPTMITWMGKEPLVRTSSTRTSSAGGGAMVFQTGQPTTGDQAKALDAEMKDADAKRRLVEFRMVYGDYKVTNGVKLPTKFRKSVDGKASEEMVVDKFAVNPKIDPKKFDVVK